jgi:hypothetical protein
MSVLKEWRCIEHGEFESSHPICPASGCESKGVAREFRTAPTIGSSFRKRFDAGIRRTSEMMGGANFRTARAGDTAFGGDVGREKGLNLLWGNESQRVLGRSFAELTQIAARPLDIKKRDGSVERFERNNAMRETVTSMPTLTRSRLPKPGELTKAKQDYLA